MVALTRTRQLSASGREPSQENSSRGPWRFSAASTGSRTAGWISRAAGEGWLSSSFSSGERRTSEGSSPTTAVPQTCTNNGDDSGDADSSGYQHLPSIKKTHVARRRMHACKCVGTACLIVGSGGAGWCAGCEWHNAILATYVGQHMSMMPQHRIHAAKSACLLPGGGGRGAQTDERWVDRHGMRVSYIEVVQVRLKRRDVVQCFLEGLFAARQIG